MLTQSTNEVPRYIEVTDGKFNGQYGYIKRPNKKPETFVCVIWKKGKKYETVLNRSQIIPVTK